MTVGKKKVKVRTIPYTNHKITVKWDPILTKRETETAMFQMMKSSKKENLTNNERVDKFFGLIMYESLDRRNSPKVNPKRIPTYFQCFSPLEMTPKADPTNDTNNAHHP